MKKENDSYKKAQSGYTPMIVPYFLSTLPAILAITIAGYLEVWLLGSGEGAVNNLAANGVVATIQSWMTAIAYFIAMGTGCLVAENKHGQEMAKGTIGVLLATVAGGLASILILVLPRNWVYVLGAKSQNATMVFNGSRLLALGIPALLLSHVLGTVFRSCGKKVISLIGLTFLGVAQIVVASLWVYAGVNSFYAVLYGFLIAQYLTMLYFVGLWIYFLFRNKKRGIKQVQEEMNGNILKEDLKEICKSGIPSLARQGSISIGIWALNLAAGIYGVAVQSLITAASRFMALPFAVIVSICQAYQPIASRSMEGKKVDKEEYLIAKRFGLWVITILSILLLVAGKRLLPFIPGNMDGEGAIMVLLISQIVALPFLMYAQLVITHFQVCRQWKEGTLLAVMRNFLLYVPVLFILVATIGVWGLLVAQGVVDLLVCPIAYIFMKKSNQYT